MYHKNIFTHQLDYFCCKLNATSWYFHVGDTLQVKRTCRNPFVTKTDDVIHKEFR